MRKACILLLFAVSSLLMGSWSIFGVEKSFVTEMSAGVLFDYLLYAIILIVVINLILRAIKTGKKSLLICIISIVIGIGISYTIVGTFAYWLFSTVIGWGLFGIILWVLISAIQGFAPGFYGVIPIGLYLAYNDPRIILYYAIPALVADLLEAMIRREPKA